MTKTLRLAEVVYIAAVAALVALVFLTRPAKGADFVVTPGAPAAPAFVVRPAAGVAGPKSGEAPQRLPGTPPPALLGWTVTFSDGSVRFVPAAPQVMPAPGVPVPQPFRGHYAGHNCPNCGTAQYVVERFTGLGTHVHRCPACRTSWEH